MGIITMIIIGLIAGAIARLLVPGKENFGIIWTAVLGIVGGYVGGTLGSLVFAPHHFELQPRSSTPSSGPSSARSSCCWSTSGSEPASDIPCLEGRGR